MDTETVGLKQVAFYDSGTNRYVTHDVVHGSQNGVSVAINFTASRTRRVSLAGRSYTIPPEVNFGEGGEYFAWFEWLPRTDALDENFGVVPREPLRTLVGITRVAQDVVATLPTKLGEQFRADRFLESGLTQYQHDFSSGGEASNSISNKQTSLVTVSHTWTIDQKKLRISFENSGLSDEQIKSAGFRSWLFSHPEFQNSEKFEAYDFLGDQRIIDIFRSGVGHPSDIRKA